MKVTWNSDSYARFLEPVFRVKPDLKTSLLTDFVSFKSGFYPAIFGKDGPYTAPNSVVSSRVYHIHLLFTKQSRNSSPYSYNRTSDSALIYTRHAKFQDVYSLLAIFPNNAHNTAKDNGIMNDIAKYAEAFQKLTNP